MNGKRPLILISNDDGFLAGGINALIRFVRGLGDVVVMAPDSPRSGTSCALTTRVPIHFHLLKQEPGLQIYRCSGTPTDCIKIAKQEVLDRTPDLVIGGINHGSNAAVNVHYSGTMGVVIEGAVCGIPSVGFSIDSHSSSAGFDHCEGVVKKIAKILLSKSLPRGVFLNVNIPAEGPLQGIRICSQTKAHWEEEWASAMHPNGSTHYWLTGRLVNEESDNQRSDLWALNNGYAAVTPLSIDMTAYECMSLLNEELSEPCHSEQFL